jgi:MFS family permease
MVTEVPSSLLNRIGPQQGTPAIQPEGSHSFVTLTVIIFLPFAAGYLLSYLFRTVNALVAPDLTAALGLTASDLGLLTSAYFLSFALAQIPLGVMLDRFGPRRVQAVLLLVAAAGSIVFGLGRTTLALAVGRVLIGLGVSGALMAGLKSLAQWFPKERIPLANGFFIMFGGLGAYAAAGPSELLLQMTDWRTLFLLLAAATALAAGLILLVVPEYPSSGGQSSVRDVVLGLRRVYRSSFFWSIAPASGCAIGAAWSVQGLWAGRWLADVEHLSRPAVVSHLSVMAAALCIGSVVSGIAIDRLKKVGVRPSTTMAGAFALFVLLDLLVVCRAPLPTYVVWAAFGAFASGTVFGYSLLAEHFPKEFAGRANTALNLIHMSVAFGLQAGMGAIVDLWPKAAGSYPPVAYQAAFALPLVLQFVSLCWMVLSLRLSELRRPLPVQPRGRSVAL